jgi:hypothetical protein
MTNSEIRAVVLTAMNEHRKKARHEQEIRMRIDTIEHATQKINRDITDEQVLQAVDYLYGAGLLKRSQETSTIKMATSNRYGTSRRTPAQPSFKHTNYFYVLTNKAVDELEGETEYSKKPFQPLQNIQINATNSAVVLGNNNNVINKSVLFEHLNQLQQVISESEQMSIEERQDIAGDIESLKQQLAKPNPNEGIMKSLWTSIGRAADIAGAATLGIEIVKLVATITGHHIG